MVVWVKITIRILYSHKWQADQSNLPLSGTHFELQDETDPRKFWMVSVTDNKGGLLGKNLFSILELSIKFNASFSSKDVSNSS